MNKMLIKNLKKIRVNIDKKEYPIFIGKGIIELFKNTIEKYDRILILTNRTIADIYKSKLVEITKGLDNIYVYRIPDGTKYKTLTTISEICDYMASNEFQKKSCIIALGGGVICDIGGYIAATYFGGIDLIQMPTSLTAQLDSSITLQECIDHNGIPDLLRAKMIPTGVISDMSFFDTLPDKEYKKGIITAIKYAVIANNNGNKRYLTLMSKHKKDIIAREDKITSEMIEDICREKKALIEGIREFKTFEECIAKSDKEHIKQIIQLLNEYDIDPKQLDIKIQNENDDNIKSKKIDTTPEKIYKKAAIDIGTNSVRLLIGEVKEKSGHISLSRELERQTNIVKLGEDVNTNHYLKKEAMERTLAVLAEYKKTADKYSINKIKAFATSAVRDAENRDEFLKAVSDIGINVECISGKEEGKLDFLGNSSLFDEKILVIDVGGGSTEFSLGTKDSIEMIKSVDVGCVRGTELFFAKGYTEDNMIDLMHWVKEKLDVLLDVESLKKGDYKVVAVAGTATTQIAIRDKMKVYDRHKVHLSDITLQELKENLYAILKKNRGEVPELIGLDPKREDVAAAGTIIIITILKQLVKDVITVSEADNLIGALIEK